ncbi:MAG: 1-deoxy-D-xylulose-5-phosphate reductoisomerase [Thermoguttaceae bacterium]|nr:1-deoxy-D-xylulose-5-phosphate reductoisomerase [Thermoguttaceae bacterium]
MSEFNANASSDGVSTPRNVAVIGASGSIGTSALDVIAASGGRLRASVLSVNNDVAKLVELAKKFRPDAVVVANPSADRAPLAELPSGIEVLWGPDALAEVVRRPEIDVVLLAIVGVAGLRVAWSALEAGQTLALANKEALVAGGSLMTDLLRTNGGKLYPVDSEHSAIFQCLLSRRLDSNSTFVDGSDVERLILTASGGPFRDWSAERLKTATVADALKHPTWQMGAKITVDSASTMNKALEIIEARWLFGLDADKISVVVHPQSIVHSMVEFVDGAVLAQLSPPDMRLPIQLALYETERRPGPTRKFDWTQSSTLEFFPPDFERFPALLLGFEVAKKGGTAGVVLNAANEIAVDAFLNGRTTFDKIPVVCRQILENHTFEEKPTLERIVELDAWARKETEIWISR